MTSFDLARTMLWHRKDRTYLYVLGVMAASVLLFLQFAFTRSLNLTATQFTDSFDFDLALVSRDYLYFNTPGNFPRERMNQARQNSAVRDAIPLRLGVVRWGTRHNKVSILQQIQQALGYLQGTEEPPESVTQDYAILLAVDPEQVPRLFESRGAQIFYPQGTDWVRDQLAQRGNGLLDHASREEFGKPPSVGDSRAHSVIGPLEQSTELRLVGGFNIGVGFAANAVVMCSQETLDEINGIERLTVDVGFLRLVEGADAQAVKQALEADLPPDVFLFTRAELRTHEVRHWTQNLPIGRFFTVGVGVALVVGLLFIYQMMVGDVRKHAAQFATLKALGYGNGYLAGVVLWQGLLLAILGFIPAVALAWLLFRGIAAWAGIPMPMTWDLILLVMGPTFLLCLGSGLLALRKVYQAAPADLF